VALLLVGVALAVWAAVVTTRAPGRVLEADRPVNAGAANPGDIRAHNSPTVVRNPRDPDNLVVTSRIDSPDFSCAVHVSTDGGREWDDTTVPVPAGGGRTCYAPDAAFEPDGTLRVSYVTLAGVANTPRAVWVASSRDGGRTLSAPTKVSGPLAFQVRIAADPAARGRLLVTWVQARDVGNLKFTAPGNPILMATSRDGGATWRRPVRVNDPRRGRVLAPSSAVGPEGELYVLYLDVGGDRLDYEGAHEGSGGPPYPGRFALVVARSLDGGQSWEDSTVDDGVVPIGRFIPFLPPSPTLAVDHDSGRIYAGFHDARLGAPDVWVWSLAPGDRAWGEPVRVNHTPRGDRSSQYLPALAVAPEGRLDVVYYDRRDDRRDRFNGVSLQSSDDGGRTFGARLALASRAFDSRIGFGSERGLPDLGSRLGVVAGEREAVSVWTDTRAGTEASNKQDLVRAVAAPARPGVDAGTAEAVGRLGFALAAGGVVALVLAGRRSTRRQ
jgi:BNR repeat-like domain